MNRAPYSQHNSPTPRRSRDHCRPAHEADSLRSAHGTRTCTPDLVADAFLSDAASPRIHWRVCRQWLDHEPDVAAHHDRGQENQ